VLFAGDFARNLIGMRHTRVRHDPPLSSSEEFPLFGGCLSYVLASRVFLSGLPLARFSGGAAEPLFLGALAVELEEAGEDFVAEVVGPAAAPGLAPAAGCELLVASRLSRRPEVTAREWPKVSGDAGGPFRTERG
jgi:hypothetical protein